jgi:Ca2+-binding RTX toxin-like protein
MDARTINRRREWWKIVRCVAIALVVPMMAGNNDVKAQSWDFTDGVLTVTGSSSAESIWVYDTEDTIRVQISIGGTTYLDEEVTADAGDLVELIVHGYGGNDEIGMHYLQNAPSLENVELYGDDGNDQMYGTDILGDTIYGGDGADYLYGLGGDDTIFGDAGADHLYGEAGNDELYEKGIYPDARDGDVDILNGGNGTADTGHYSSGVDGDTIASIEVEDDYDPGN